MALWERGWSSNEKIQSNPRRSGYIADLRPWNTGADLEKHPGRYVRVTRTSWLLFHFFFSPIFLIEKRDDGENKKTVCVFCFMKLESEFFFPNLLYKGFSIRVMVFWRFFQDVFSMFHVSLRCRRWSPFSKWTSLVRSNSAFSNPQGRLDVFSAAWVTYKKTTGTSSNFSGKKDPHETFAFFFFFALIYLYPFKKKTTGI